MTGIEEINNSRDFAAIAEPWDSCLLAMDKPSFFLTSSWLLNWWTAWGRDRTLCILIVKDGERILAGAPLFRHRTRYYKVPVRELTFVGDRTSDRQEFIHRPGQEEALTEIWRHLQAGRADHDLIRLEEVPVESATLAAAEQAGLGLASEPTSVLPCIRCSTSWEDFEKTLSRKFRAEMRTRTKVFDSWGDWDFVVKQGAEVVPELDEIRDLELQSLKEDRGYALFADPRNESLLRRIIAVDDVGITPWLSLLRVEGKIVGYLLGFVFADKYHAYNMAFLPDYIKGSPGKWIMHNTIRHVFEAGCGEFDFLRGANYMKSKWHPDLRENLRAVAFCSPLLDATLRPAVFRLRPWLKNMRARSRT